MEPTRKPPLGGSRLPASRRRTTMAVGLVALLALAAGLLAGCGGSEGEEATLQGETSGAEFDDDAVEADTGGFEASDEAADPAIETPATTVASGESRAVEDAVEEAAEEGEAADGDQAEAPPDDGGQLGAGGAGVTPSAADLGRQLIFTAQVHVGVDDVAAASEEATSIIQGIGGFVFGQNTTGGAEPSSELVFKVLPDDFNRALEELGTVGELRNQTVTTDDVTERIVDLESRIQVAELGVTRLREALEATTDLEDYARVEELLLTRESDLEVMRGQLRTLQDRVDLATITLLLTQDRVENAIDLRVTAYEGHDGGGSCHGEDRLEPEAGTDVTVCFEVINRGDQTLVDIALTDTVLEIDASTELLEVFGSLESLPPGQSTLVAHEITAEHPIRPRPTAEAVPTDGVSSEPVGPTVKAEAEYDLRAFEPDRPPGFGDGFSVAVAILQGLWAGLVVAVGFVIPMLVFVPVVALVWWGGRQLRRRRPPRYTPPPPGAVPPPPPPPGTPSSSASVSAPAASEASGVAEPH